MSNCCRVADGPMNASNASISFSIILILDILASSLSNKNQFRFRPKCNGNGWHDIREEFFLVRWNLSARWCPVDAIQTEPNRHWTHPFNCRLPKATSSSEWLPVPLFSLRRLEFNSAVVNRWLLWAIVQKSPVKIDGCVIFEPFNRCYVLLFTH